MNREQISKGRVVLYCRIAAHNQLDHVAIHNELDDFALNAQSARLRQQAERDGLEVVGEVRVYENGTTLNRPGWHNALYLATEQEADAIMVKQLDRVARGLPLLAEALAELDKRGLQLRTCDGDLPFTPGFGQYIL